MGSKKGDDVEFPWTAPMDPRFPNTNATRYCFQMFVDHQRCTRLFGKRHEPCSIFEKTYRSICPNDWVKKWVAQIKEGTFPLDLPEPVEEYKKKKK